MKVQIRLRGPDGQVRLEVEEESTLKDLVELIKEKTNVGSFSLKYGYPLAELDISPAALSSTVAALKLRNETIVVVPHESATSKAPVPSQADVQQAPEPFTAKGIEPDETVVEWPERGGYLCEFIILTALSSAVNMTQLSA